jgi:hypothetical protein
VPPYTQVIELVLNDMALFPKRIIWQLISVRTVVFEVLNWSLLPRLASKAKHQNCYY